MLGPYDKKMVRRVADQQLAMDEYHRWVQSPESLVTRQFYLAAKAANIWSSVTPPFGGAGDHVLSGNVLRFEQVDRKAHVRIEVWCRNAAGDMLFAKTYSLEEPIDAPTPAGFAAAMAKAVDTLVSQALTDVAAAISTRVADGG